MDIGEGQELYRLKGELLLLQGKGDAGTDVQTDAEVEAYAGAEADAESYFTRAIDVSRQQQAKSWELRSAMSLCRLRRRQGRREEARQLLAEIYQWFTEGFDTPDLKDAGTLLEEMNHFH